MIDWTVQTTIPKDDPMMIAWEKLKQTKEYENSRSGACRGEGALWFAFVEGWKAGKGANDG